MVRGILETIGLAGTVLFAAPVALLGAEFLVGGQTLEGLAFLGIAALMIAVPRYVRSPTDVASDTVEDVAGTVVKTDDGDGND